jgi:PPM family protein phosphatase
MTPHSFGLSDIGLGRQNNEDVWLSIPELGFFALADGMGGHNAGEVAAQTAIHSLATAVKEAKSSEFLDWIHLLRYAIEEANLVVYQIGQEKAECQGMGTTLCCLLLSKNSAIYAHVGDSRIYRLRNQKLSLLTQDHSLFAKWLKNCKSTSTPFPYRNIITRAIGTSLKANPEIAYSESLPGDLFLLCSDGLSDVLELEEIENILLTFPDLEIASKKLIEMAKLKGSCDNITLLLVEGHGKDLSRQQRDDSARPESFQGDADRLERPSGKPL